MGNGRQRPFLNLFALVLGPEPIERLARIGPYSNTLEDHKHSNLQR